MTDPAQTEDSAFLDRQEAKLGEMNRGVQRCVNCGAPLGDGEGKCFTICEPCWDKAHAKTYAPDLQIPQMPTDPPDDTPRTDAAKWRSDSGIELVVAVLAEQLERELAEAITGREFACEAREVVLRQAVTNLRMLCQRIARADNQEKREELVGHALRIAESRGCGPNILREYTEEDAPPVVSRAIADELAEALKTALAHLPCDWRPDESKAVLAKWEASEKP